MSATAKPKELFREQFEESSANYSEANQNQDTMGGEGKPIQLIKIRPNGKIQINEQALEIISSIDTPIGFVSLVGKMRTGKSCLLNRLLYLSGKGFKVDPSTQSCTQGIWMWSKPYENKQCNDAIFFLDTEGTDSFNKDVENDTKIFTLAVLLSSYFIYNSIGSIDQRSLSELQMITALSKTIQTGSETGSESDKNQQLSRFMPKFIWLLRDFMLQIEDDKGRKITSTQYLENCLSDQSGKNQNFKKIKKSILTYFVNRECLTLVRPVQDQQDLHTMNNLPDYGLRRQFIDGVNTLRKKIMTNTAAKMFEGENITGYAMASMIQSYVQAFNSGKVPNIKSAWQQISEDEGAVAYAKALQKYEQIFHRQFSDDEPKGEEEVYKILFKLKEQTLRQFQEQSFQNKNEQYRKKLQQFIQQKYQSIIEGNKNTNELKNIEILQRHAQKLRTRIEGNYYMSKDHQDELKVDMNQVVSNYHRDAKGHKKDDIISQFITFLTPIILNMKSDNTEQMEQQRQLEIKIKEYEMKDRAQKAEKESIAKQLQAKNNAIALKAAKKDKAIIPKENPDKQKKSGCCAGGKCEVM